MTFWFPSSQQGFDALGRGEPFVFKAHSGAGYGDLGNRIVGLWLFSGYARLRISEAWRWLGRPNGASGTDEFGERIAQYLRVAFSTYEDQTIGCVLLKTVRLFSDEDSFGVPADFSSNIVRGKRYELDSLASDHPSVRVIARYLGFDARSGNFESTSTLSRQTRGEPRLAIPRVGQQAFKALNAEAYHHRCALTADKVRPVLEAAHIMPVAAGGEHRIDNGLLLRSDMHTLFDRGYIGFDPKYHLRVSPPLRDQFGNGDWLYAHEGEEIAVPDRRAHRPDRDFLEWHNEAVFLSAT